LGDHLQNHAGEMPLANRKHFELTASLSSTAARVEFLKQPGQCSQGGMAPAAFCVVAASAFRARDH